MKLHKIWNGFSAEVFDFKGIKNYLRVSVSMGAPFYLEWLYFEI